MHHASRWLAALAASLIGFAVTWWLAEGALETDSAVTVAAVVATSILTPLGFWASKAAPPSPVPAASVVPATPAPESQPDRPAPIVVGDIPGEAVAWQERHQLLDRLRILASSDRPTVVCAVTGQRGIGKTQLAAAYARQRAANDWPVVVWVTADTELRVLTGLDQLAAAAGVRQPTADTAQGAAAALAWLRTHPGPCLLVYDNAVDADLIQRFTPTVGAVQTVVTTTELHFANLGVTVDVGLFTETEALTYLRERTGLADDAGALAVAAQLGRLPVALAQAGALVGGGRRFPAYRAYLDRLDQLPIGELLRRQPGDPYPRGAAEAILLSLDDLAAADPTGAARRLLDQLAVLAPNGVDPVLLGHVVGPTPAAGDDPAELVAVLAQRSLTMPTLDQERTVVHRLIQRVVRDRAAQLGTLDSTVVGAAEAIGQAADVSQDWQDRTRLGEYADHAMALRRHPITSATKAQVIRVLGVLLSLNNRVHNWTTSVSIGPVLVADCEQVLGPDHPDTLTSRTNLAFASQAVGRLDEAIELITRSLADSERVLGPDHPDTLTRRNNLARAYDVVGRLDEAIALFIRTLADSERILGPDHPDTLRARNNLASAYHVGGSLGEAIELFTRNLADSERVLGPDHPDTLSRRNNLAHAYQVVGRLDEAIELYTRTLADTERVLGPDHPSTLISRSNLGGLYEVLGRLDEAVELHSRTLADRERILGPDHPDTLISRNNLAYIFQATGRLDEAVVLYTRNLADSERILGPDHPNTLLARNNVGYAYRAMGRLDDAIALYSRTLADRERILGPDHPDTLLSRANLAYVYEAVGRLDEATALRQPGQPRQ